MFWFMCWHPQFVTQKNEIVLLLFFFLMQDYKAAFRLTTQTWMENSHVLIIVRLFDWLTVFPCVTKWEQMRLRHERQGRLALNDPDYSSCLLESKRAAGMFRSLLFSPDAWTSWSLGTEEVMSVVPLLCFCHMRSGRWTDSDSRWLRDTVGHSLREDSRPRLQRHASWWPQAVCHWNTELKGALNATTERPAYQILFFSALVVFATCL